jgi:acetyltransferase-like isoleucine patch superfamily enzyme
MKKILLKIYSFFQSLSDFKKFGRYSVIKWPFKIWNRNCIEIGSNVFIAENSFFSVSQLSNKKPILKIGDGVCIGSNFFAACVDEIIIENDVLLSDRVFISDHIHDYHDVNKPVISQPLLARGTVKIKSGAFIGINSVIMPGVSIGHNSVVGASSIVTSDVPDYCVVVGNPARVIKKYDADKKEWEKISN